MWRRGGGEACGQESDQDDTASLQLPFASFAQTLFCSFTDSTMSFFDVPGWSVPTAPTIDSGSRKRKRPQSDDTDKLHGATVNFEKLIKKLDTGESKTSDSRTKANKKNKNARGDDKADHGKAVGKQRTEHQKKGSHERPGATASPPPQKSKSSKKGKAQATSPANTPPTPSKKKNAPPKSNGGLTALQSNMKSGLDGARFR